MQTTIDKSKELKASVSLVSEKLHFHGIVEENTPISIDYTPPLGNNLGYTSLELLLLSLSSCIGSTILIFLRKMQKTISDCTIHSHGFRNEEHPTGFKKIIVEISLKSPDVNENDLMKVVSLSEQTYCPVWAMLKGNVEIEIKPNITEV